MILSKWKVFNKNQKAFPNLYLWTTYSIVGALEHLWRNNHDQISQQHRISPYVIEITAVLERALAMAYTGDARVIVKGLMEPFCLKRSLLEQGLPSLTKLIRFDQSISEQFAHTPANWPLTSDNEPAVASKRCQVLTFGKDHFLVSCRFHFAADRRLSFCA
jgi:hypothetical protein